MSQTFPAQLSACHRASVHTRPVVIPESLKKLIDEEVIEVLVDDKPMAVDPEAWTFVCDWCCQPCELVPR